MPLNMMKVIAQVAKVRGEREEMIVLRRGDTTLGEQPVRIERLSGMGMPFRTVESAEVRADVIVLGAIDFDVQFDDRFNDSNGILYRVIFVNPNRQAAVIAEAKAVE